MSAHARAFLSLGNYGCDEFIEKPFNSSDLLQCIEPHLKLKEDVNINY